MTDLTGDFADDAGFHYQEPDLTPVPYSPGAWDRRLDGRLAWIGTVDPGRPLAPEDVVELTEGMKVRIDGRVFTVASVLPGNHGAQHAILEEKVTDD